MSTVVVRDRFQTAQRDMPAPHDPSHLANLVSRLQCPTTGQRLRLSADEYCVCGVADDSVSYPVRDGVPLLLEGDELRAATNWRPARRQLRRQRVWSLIPSPVSGARQKRYLRQFLATRGPGELILNVGSAGWHIGPGVVNVDLLPYVGVDLCANIRRMPFADGEVDAVVCNGVLEHIADPTAAVGEFHRILRPGGAVFCTVPFMQGYHEDPADYRRFTLTGLEQLFETFSAARVRPSHGVGSALAWIAADALAAVLAVNVNWLHTLWVMLLRCVFAPLRLLDRFSEGSRFEHLACSALLIEAVR
ncbi:MAG: methyltransferase domain-containing protein [Planctomycetota bacterium]|jgi:SAM-dependent methyltransferase